MTFRVLCAKFEGSNAVTKTCCFRRIPREAATLVQGSRNTAKTDTTSEPPGRNARTGAPVKASMSDGYAVTRVEPWNTLYPTPDLSGDGIFLLSPLKTSFRRSGSSFAPNLLFAPLEIHKVFLRGPKLDLFQNFLPTVRKSVFTR